MGKFLSYGLYIFWHCFLINVYLVWQEKPNFVFKHKVGDVEFVD